MDKIKALIDTNVLLDHLAHREGFCQDAAVIFSMIDEGQLIGIVSSISIVNCAYVLPKHYNGDAVLEQIKTMLRMFTISHVDASVLEQAAVSRHTTTKMRFNTCRHFTIIQTW